jgi:hypothetical protein
MTLGIQVNEIKHVLLADRWHEVEPESFALDSYEFMDGEQAVARGDGQLITSVGFMFREPGGQIVGRSALLDPGCAAAAEEELTALSDSR